MTAVIRRLLVAIGALAVLALLVAVPLAVRFRDHGISARDEPIAVEAAVAGKLVEAEGLETLVLLTGSEGNWRVSHSHTSSRRRPAAPSAKP